ncbi:hypothetical protein [Streptomyces sp. cmx-4-9]|uniref:hypothetical protein n=1 Tax=Streptomyces sp. cmx-4-9 TaxID=2790941 RepID=UPI003981127B
MTTRNVPAVAGQADTRSKYTLLLDQDDALTLDEIALALRRRTGRRVEKAEILRDLIRLTGSDPVVAGLLAAGVLRRDATG